MSDAFLGQDMIPNTVLSSARRPISSRSCHFSNLASCYEGEVKAKQSTIATKRQTVLNKGLSGCFLLNASGAFLTGGLGVVMAAWLRATIGSHLAPGTGFWAVFQYGNGVVIQFLWGIAVAFAVATATYAKPLGPALAQTVIVALFATAIYPIWSAVSFELVGSYGDLPPTIANAITALSLICVAIVFFARKTRDEQMRRSEV